MMSRVNGPGGTRTNMYEGAKSPLSEYRSAECVADSGQNMKHCGTPTLEQLAVLVEDWGTLSEQTRLLILEAISDSQ